MVTLRALAGEAELQRLRLGRGDVERAKHPVPQGQVDAKIPVEVARRIAVMDLVLGRAVEHMLDGRAER